MPFAISNWWCHSKVHQSRGNWQFDFYQIEIIYIFAYFYHRLIFFLLLEPLSRMLPLLWIFNKEEEGNKNKHVIYQRLYNRFSYSFLRGRSRCWCTRFSIKILIVCLFLRGRSRCWCTHFSIKRLIVVFIFSWPKSVLMDPFFCMIKTSIL